MDVSGQPHDPVTLPTRKEPPVPFGRRLGGPEEPVWMRWWRERNSFVVPAGNRAPIFQSVSSHCIDWCTATHYSLNSDVHITHKPAYTHTEGSFEGSFWFALKKSDDTKVLLVRSTLKEIYLYGPNLPHSLVDFWMFVVKYLLIVSRHPV